MRSFSRLLRVSAGGMVYVLTTSISSFKVDIRFVVLLPEKLLFALITLNFLCVLVPDNIRLHVVFVLNELIVVSLIFDAFC